MSKFIYHSTELRCKIKYEKGYKHYHCQLQERRFGFLWLNVYKFLTLKEGFWGEGGPIKMLRDTYRYGDFAEVYATGDLHIEERIKEFFKQYMEAKLKDQQALLLLKY